MAELSPYKALGHWRLLTSQRAAKAHFSGFGREARGSSVIGNWTSPWYRGRWTCLFDYFCCCLTVIYNLHPSELAATPVSPSCMVQLSNPVRWSGLAVEAMYRLAY